MFSGNQVDNILKMDSLIKYYLKIPTENMSDDEWAITFNGLVWALDRENKMSKR